MPLHNVVPFCADVSVSVLTGTNRSRRSSRLSEAGGSKDDGSVKDGLGSGAGQSGSGMAGLGWSTSAEDEASLTGLDSTFDSFRKQRAGRYRDNLAQAAANAQAG